MMNRAFTRYADSRRKRPARVWMWLVVVLFLTLAGLAIGGWVWVKNYLRSDEFRRMVSQRTSELLKVNGEFDSFRWSGDSVYSNSFRGTGLPGSPIGSIHAQSLRSEVDLGGIRDGSWVLPQLSVGRLQLSLEQPVAAVAGEEPPVSRSATQGGTAFSSWIPSRVDLRETLVEQADVSWSGGSLRRTRLDIRPLAEDISIRGNGGVLAFEGWPDMSVDNFNLRLSDGVTYLLGSDLSHSNGGVMTAAGEFNGSAGSHVQLDFQGLPSDTVLKASVARHLRGIMQGSVKLHQATPNSPWLAKGDITLREGLLRDLPTLRLLAKFTGVVQFENLVLQKTDITFEQFADRIEITRLISESDGLVRIEGGCTLTSDRINGEFEVGVTPGTLRWMPGAREKVFTRSAGPYLWTTVRITGTPSAPQNDLAPRLAAALEDVMIDTVKDTMEGATEVIKGGTRGVLDILLPR